MKILRNKIKTKKMPIIWLEGTEGSGKLNHACNIAQRFDYSHIQVENLIKKGAEKMNRRGKYIKHKLMANRKLPDVSNAIKEASGYAVNLSNIKCGRPYNYIHLFSALALLLLVLHKSNICF